MSPDGQRVASGGPDNEVLIWSTHPQHAIRSVRRQMTQCIPCFSPDSQLVAVARGWRADCATLFYDLREGHFLETEAPGFPISFSESEWKITVASPSADAGKTILREWDLNKSQTSWQAEFAPRKADASCFPGLCAGRKLVAQGFYDGYVILANYREGRVLGSWKAHEGAVDVIAFSPDGEAILTAGGAEDPDEGICLVWSCSDTHNPKSIYVAESGRRRVHAAAFSPDGTILATGSHDGQITLRKATTGEVLHELVGHKQSNYALAFDPEGRTLASANYDGTVRLWHAATGRELARFELESCGTAVAFSPDGKTLVATSGPNPFAPNQLYIWQVSYPKEGSKNADGKTQDEEMQ